MNTPAPHSVFWNRVEHQHTNNKRAGTYRALPSQPLDLAVGVDLVVLEDGHLDLLALVLDLFGSVIRLLLPLLGSAT